MERVGVLHKKLTRPHDTKTWPDFISELHLYLVEVDGKLSVAVQLITRQFGDDLLVGGAKTELSLVAVRDTQ